MAERTAYNPYDPTQARFLAALARGESAGGAYGLFQGVGNYDLSGAPRDEYGFPIWQGWGNSHAAGWFQFQPGTWEEYAERYQLDFQRPDDQKAAAWYLAQDTYARRAGGSLTSALERGDYASIQSALEPIWPSVKGNKAAPGGLTESLQKGLGVDVDTRGVFSDDTTKAGIPGLPSFPGLPFSVPGLGADTFARIGLLVLGAIIILIALWYLLSQATDGAVPDPTDTVKTVAKGAATVAAVVA